MVPTLILNSNPIQQIVENIEIRTLHMQNCSIHKFIFAEHKVRSNDKLVAINTLPDRLYTLPELSTLFID